MGASAGGLEALEALFAAMPEDTGIAFVVLQHLSPDFESRMDELLARHTSIPIQKVTDGIPVEPNRIYLIPPRKDMILSGGRLLLTDKDPGRGLTLPIDHFLRSLAQDVGARSVAVILSGTGSDGSRGILDVHAAGGLVISQEPGSARFDGMPRSAIDTGVVDAQLSAPAIAEALSRYARTAVGDVPALGQAGKAAEALGGVGEILALLRATYGIEFAHYKPSTVMRRIERRLSMSRLDDLESYAHSLTHDSAELDALYCDLLIGVTRFFRDPEAFLYLESHVIPQLAESKDDVRVWVPGCATGEEVYSLAILLHEAMSRRGRRPRAKIFATDVHPESLEKASAGTYDQDALRHVSAARHQRYFTSEGDRFRISKELREMVVFARHNVISDAPFTRLDLVSCRNLLIYFQPAAQKKALSLFHFGLKTSGFLLLGPSESPGELSDEFDAIDGHWKIYRKRRDIRLPTDLRLVVPPVAARPGRSIAAGRRLADGVLLAAYDQLLQRHVPPAVLVDQQYELLHVFGGVEKILTLRGGRASTNLLDLLPDRLRAAVAGALGQAAKQRKMVRYSGLDGVSVGEGAERARFGITVEPLPEPKLDTTNFLVQLERIAPHERQAPVESVDVAQASQDYVASLENELRFTRENLQATIEELETSNEELQATNEELVAANEELQSTNEELHSVNEELHTVNVEHQRKIDQLTELTDDMDNLLQSTEIGVLFLDPELRVRKFTSRMAELFHLLPQDVGRRFDSFARDIDYPDLLGDLSRVLGGESSVECEVHDTGGHVHLLRVLPYCSREEVSGVVVTVIDISNLRRAEAESKQLSAVVKSAREAIITMDLDGRITAWNQGAEDLYGYTEDDALGMDVRLLVPETRRAEHPQLLARLGKGESMGPVETQRLTRDGRRVDVELSCSPMRGASGRIVGASSIARDITARRRAEEQVRRTIAQRDQFLALLSHELRNPLMGLANAVRVLERSDLSAEAQASARGVVKRQVKQMARLLEDLLDSSRMRRDRIELRREQIDLRSTLDGVLDAARPQAEQSGVELVLEVPDGPVSVDADPGRLQQLQSNLLNNAIRFSRRGGVVRYRLAIEDERAVLEVEDDGQGIAADALPHVFEPFFQASSRAPGSKGAVGMGLGLALAQSIAQAHGGEICASSEGEGRGARFTVRLPLSAPQPGQTEEAAGAVEWPVNPRSVLLVDDDRDSRELLGVLLEHAGHEILHAGTGAEGLEMLLSRRPAAALVDIGLPDMSGLEVARKARASLPSQDLLLVALTGFGQQKDREAAIAAGFDHHLVKPLEFETLESLLDNHTSR